jgi:hypothetical protein
MAVGVLVCLFSIADLTPDKITSLHDIYETLQERRHTVALAAIEENTMISLYDKVVGRPPVYTEDGENIANPAVGYGWRLMANRCTPGFCMFENGNKSLYYDDNSMGLDVGELPGLVMTIKEILQELPLAFPVTGIAMRFNRPSENLMSVAYGRKTVVVELITHTREDPFRTPKNGIAAQQAILQAMVGIGNVLSFNIGLV